MIRSLYGATNTPTKRPDAQPLVEREKQFECLQVEISRSLKGKTNVACSVYNN